MGKEMNISLIAHGELFGFPAEFGIARIGGETVIAGSLHTEGRQLCEFIQNKEVNVTDLVGSISVFPKAEAFSIDFASKAGSYTIILTFTGVACGIILTDSSKQLLLILKTERLRTGNKFERFVAEITGWLRINTLLLVVQNRGGGNSLGLLRQLSDEFATASIPPGYETYQLMATGIFDLEKTGFGQCVKKLSGLHQLKFAIGGNLADQTFGARLMGDPIETDIFIMDGLMFGIQKSATDFLCQASGTFIFKLGNYRLGFTLCGTVSNTSFTLSASSLPGVCLPLNSRLSFSDLGLSIGVTPTGLSLGMIGRLNTNNLSVFGGFVINPTPLPEVILLTAALTSATGRISLKDFIVEIADIHWELVNCLDVVAIGDFDLTDTSLPNGITGYPDNMNDENYEKDKSSIESRVVDEFNRKMDSALRINGQGQLSPLGNNSGQFILTDKGTMRHYRIDRNGRISLNCQIYVCTQSVTLGEYNMPVGFFACGTLEIFGKKARFLFLINKGKSLVTLIQIQKIDLAGIFVISKSSKLLPMEAINGGLAGQLVKPNDDGAILYLSIQKDKGEVVFYLNAYISILYIFKFEALIIIKDRWVTIDIEYVFCGFKVLFKLKGGYLNFSTANFEANVVFDTSGFLDIVKKAQEKLKSAAQSVKSNIEATLKKINEAQASVNNLLSKINEYNNRIAQCKRDISKAKWYQFWIKIARCAEIAGLEIAKAGVYVAIGVANAALEVAKAAVKLGGAVAVGVLDSLAYIINAVTQILWIKSFELGITVNSTSKKINARLVLIVLGKEVQIGGELDINGLIDNIKSFVTGKISHQSDQAIEDIKGGKTSRAIEAGEGPDQTILAACSDLTGNKERYAELLALRESVNSLFIDSNNAYFDAYNEEEPGARESACHLTALHWEEERFEEQHSESFDDRFVDSLDTVIQTIRQEKSASRADLSDEMDRKMDELLDTVRMLNSNNKSRAQRASSRESLFARLERNTDAKRRSMRTRAANAEISAEEANERYVNTMSNLLDVYLGDKKGAVAEDLRRTLGIALYQFRNPDGTFSKHDNDDHSGDDEDL